MQRRIICTDNRTQSRGFTILELSIVLLISGVLMAAVIEIFDVYGTALRNEEARATIDTSTSAIDGFFISQKRYPCPANPTLLPTDPNYGMEDCTMATVAGAQAATPALPVLVGLFPLYAQTTDVSSGAPVRTKVSLNEFTDKTKSKNYPFTDPWSQRLTYAVTKQLTGDTDGLPNADRTDRKRGNIAIVDEFGANTGGTSGDADYVIISHGSDGIGAYVDHGALIACDASYTLENENCNNDSKFVQSLMNSNDKVTAAYFDDYLGYNRTVVSSLWAKRDSTEDTIYNVGNGNVGIGTTSTPTARLEVQGSLQADRISSAQKLCDANGDNCVQPSTLYNVKCNGNQVIKEVKIDADGKMDVVCENLKILDNTKPKQNCAPNPSDIAVLRGIYSNGEIKCSNDP